MTNAATNNEATTNNAQGEQPVKHKRYNYRGNTKLLAQGTDKNGNPWATFSVKRAGKKTTEAVVFGEKVAKALDMLSQAGNDKVLNVFGYFDPKKERSFDTKDGRTVKIRQLQVLDVNWPLPARSKAEDAADEQAAEPEMAQANAADEDVDNPF